MRDEYDVEAIDFRINDEKEVLMIKKKKVSSFGTVAKKKRTPKTRKNTDPTEVGTGYKRRRKIK